MWILDKFLLANTGEWLLKVQREPPTTSKSKHTGLHKHLWIIGYVDLSKTVQKCIWMSLGKTGGKLLNLSIILAHVLVV